MKCSEFLDIKSCVMFSKACRRTRNSCEELLKSNVYTAVSEVIRQVIDVAKTAHETVSNPETQKSLMADILRKIIFSSVTDEVNTNGTSSIAHTKCVAEYNLLLDYFTESMDVTWKQFNILLEDAQFEFRGYNIIGMAEEHRIMLNEFKRRIHNIYFDENFTIHTYLSLTEVDMEINYDGKTFTFYLMSNYGLSDTDSDSNDGDNGGNAHRIQYFPSELHRRKNTDDVEINDLLREIEKCDTLNDRDVISWKSDDATNKHMANLLSKLLLKVMPEVTTLLKGTTKTTLEFWNTAMDHNWLLGEVLNNLAYTRGYKAMLSNITFEHQDIFHLCSLAKT